MTAKLYWDDSHLISFKARINGSQSHNGRTAILLDQTAFYPEGGGQPSDRGTIGGRRVVAVIEQDDGTILHILEDGPELIDQGEVNCEVDADRRREMMQQHTGQHILSQAFFRLFGAETRGFRITDRVSEIDLALEAHEEQIPDAIEQAEQMANRVVFDDRVIRSLQLTPEEASLLPLRKESFVTDCVRVVEIDDFDLSPCGGTHAKRTGEVGLIVVRGWERAKRMVRVEFLCGLRAVADYREANRVSEAIARRFTVSRNEAEDSVARLIDANKALTRRVRAFSETVIESEARSLSDEVQPADGVRTIIRVFDGRDYDEVKLLAHRLVARDSTVAILVTKSPAMARIVVARSADLDLDSNRLVKTASEILGGRGGGTPDFAQGGGPKVDQIERALESLDVRL
jgi:alanyl-tRNA synthetase